jgi:hypothetical protein
MDLTLELSEGGENLKEVEPCGRFEVIGVIPRRGL